MGKRKSSQLKVQQNNQLEWTTLRCINYHYLPQYSLKKKINLYSWKRTVADLIYDKSKDKRRAAVKITPAKCDALLECNEMS